MQAHNVVTGYRRFLAIGESKTVTAPPLRDWLTPGHEAESLIGFTFSPSV